MTHRIQVTSTQGLFSAQSALSKVKSRESSQRMVSHRIAHGPQHRHSIGTAQHSSTAHSNTAQVQSTVTQHTVPQSHSTQLHST